MRFASAVVFLFVAFGCSDATLTPTPGAQPPTKSPTSDGGAEPNDAGGASDGDAARPDSGIARTSNVRIMAANISSGPGSNYDTGEGIRIFQGLHPDIALVQELNYKTNSKEDLDAFVADAFGAGYAYYREESVQIPNGIVSRYPILASGRWTDPQVANRGFVYAKIDVPGPHDLWAVSVHLLTTSSGNRSSEATALVAQLDGVVGAGDYVVVGGDFNTSARTEACVKTLGKYLDIEATPPADQDGNDFTNAPRNQPYDWVLASPSLGAFQVPTVIGGSSFSSGLVFDSRVYTPLTDVAPIEKTDSEAENMQHMPVVKDFTLSE